MSNVVMCSRWDFSIFSVFSHTPYYLFLSFFSFLFLYLFEFVLSYHALDFFIGNFRLLVSRFFDTCLFIFPFPDLRFLYHCLSFHSQFIFFIFHFKVLSWCFVQRISDLAWITLPKKQSWEMTVFARKS